MLSRKKEEDFVITGPSSFKKMEVETVNGQLMSTGVEEDLSKLGTLIEVDPTEFDIHVPVKAVHYDESLPWVKKKLSECPKPPQPHVFVLRNNIDSLMRRINENDKRHYADPSFIDYWSSRPLPKEKWADRPGAELLDVKPNVELSVFDRGLFNLELSQASIAFADYGEPNALVDAQDMVDTPEMGSMEDIAMAPVIDYENDYPFYMNFFSTVPHENYACPDVPAIVSVVRIGCICKVISRTKAGTQRLLLPNDNVLKRLKAALPFMQNNRIVKLNTEVAQRISSTVDVAYSPIVKELVAFETMNFNNTHKFGLVYCKPNERDEDSMFGVQEGSEAYEEFLDFIGTRVTLKGFTGYRGGLDVKADNTGTTSVYTKFRSHEVMFHVATMLPYSEADVQHVERKRHIGNDVSVLVFKEQADEDDVFDPSIFRSHFIHCVFIVTPVRNPETNAVDSYQLSVATKGGVPPYPPFLPETCIFPKDEFFRQFLLCKMINGGRAALVSPEFGGVSTSRKERLKFIIEKVSKQ